MPHGEAISTKTVHEMRINAPRTNFGLVSATSVSLAVPRTIRFFFVVHVRIGMLAG
jgi:hypothetical protein